MSEVYNPETLAFEELSSQTVEARRLRASLDASVEPSQRDILERQLHEVETRIRQLRQRFQSRRLVCR